MHDDGPSEHCWRCDGWFRGDHECYGKPAETIELFVRTHGFAEVSRWLGEADMKMRNEQKSREQKEREGQILELRKKIEEGRAAALRLKEMGE